MTTKRRTLERVTASDLFLLMWDDYGWSSDIGGLAIVDGAALHDPDGRGASGGRRRRRTAAIGGRRRPTTASDDGMGGASGRRRRRRTAAIGGRRRRRTAAIDDGRARRVKMHT